MTRPTVRLRRAIQNKTLVPFIGAGVSVACASLPTWPGLLQAGVDYLNVNAQRLGIPSKEIGALRGLIKISDNMTGLSKLQKLLAKDESEHWKSEEYAAWLESLFGNPAVRNSVLMERIEGLRPRVIATTNYDLLLERHLENLDQSVTWERPQDLRALLRAGRGVAHLHGRYDRPGSIVLSDSDYQRIIDNRDAFRVSQSLFEVGILLFIGVSPDGATDPHLTKLLENFAQLSDSIRGEDNPHVLLHHGEIDPRDRVRLRTRGVEALRYGLSYDDLEGFLSELAEPERIVVDVNEVSEVVRSVLDSDGVAEGVRRAARHIHNWVYRGREIRVGYAELDPPGSSGSEPKSLIEKYVIPGQAACVFHYPITIAGWALAEGNIIGWPDEQKRPCDLEKIRKMNLMEETRARINGEVADPASPARAYVDLEEIAKKLDDGNLTLSDIYQDWSNTERDIVFNQFVSVPVPRVVALTNTKRPDGVGVFNIDTLEHSPSLAGAEERRKLSLISDLVYELYRRRGYS